MSFLGLARLDRVGNSVDMYVCTLSKWLLYICEFLGFIFFWSDEGDAFCC